MISKSIVFSSLYYRVRSFIDNTITYKDIVQVILIVPVVYFVIDALLTIEGQNVNDVLFKIAWLIFPIVISITWFSLNAFYKKYDIKSFWAILALIWFLFRLNNGAANNKSDIHLALNESYFIILQSIFWERNLKAFFNHHLNILQNFAIIFFFLAIMLAIPFIYSSRDILLLQSFLIFCHFLILYFEDLFPELLRKISLYLYLSILLALLQVIVTVNNSGQITTLLSIFISILFLILKAKLSMLINVVTLFPFLFANLFYWYVSDFSLALIAFVASVIVLWLRTISVRTSSGFFPPFVKPLMLTICVCIILIFSESNPFSGTASMLYVLFFLALGFLAISMLESALNRAKTLHKYLYICFFIFCLFVFFDLNVQYEAYHQGFFLGPVLDVINGRSPLFDINGQYGVGIFYGISAILGFAYENATFSNFSKALNILNILYLFLFAHIIAQITSNKLISLLMMFFGALIFHTNSFSGYLPQMFPSTGALRFAFGYIPVVIYLNSTSNDQYYRYTRLFLVLFGSWSFEASFPSLVSSIVVSTCIQLDSRSSLITHMKQIVTLILCVAGSWLLILIVGYCRSDSMPDIRHYIEFTQLYGGGFGWVSPSLQDAWTLYGLLCVCGLIVAAVCYRSSLIHTDEIRKRALKKAVVLGSISLLIYLYSSYYVYRAHNSNLYHIMWPALIIAIVVIDIFLERQRVDQDSKLFAINSVLCFSLFTGYRVVNYSEQLPYTIVGKAIRLSGSLLIDNIKYSLKERTISLNNMLSERDQELHEYLLERQNYVREIALFVSEESLLRSRTGTAVNNKIMSAFMPQDEIVPIGIRMMYDSIQRIENNEEIVIALNALESPGILPSLVRDLCATKKGRIISKTKYFVYVIISEDKSSSEEICPLVWR